MSNKKTYPAMSVAMSILLYAGFSNADAATLTNTTPPAPPAFSQNGQPPAPPDGQLPPGPPPDGQMPPNGQPGGPQQQTKSASELKATKIVDNQTATLDKQQLTNNQTDENVVLARNDAKLSLTDSTLTKTGDSSNADASNFSGQNAIFLAADSEATLNNVTLTSDADGANAVFATGQKSKITASHLKIHTQNNSSRGLDATYGGNITANDVDITTEGQHCAALATDRGEGNVTVDGATLKTSGDGSPCVYSTGNIQLSNANGEATGSEIAVVEGKNSITLNKVNLTGHKKHGVMLYQSFSGDASVGNATFTATDSTLNNASDGPMFFITNTTATANLTRTQLTQSGDTLVDVTSANWGQSGKNGGNFTLNTQEQQLTGDIKANNISQLHINLGDQTTWTGTINNDNQAQATELTLAKTAQWTLTNDAHVTTFTDAQSDYSNIQSNGHNIYYSKAKNPTLNGKTFKLPGGGKLIAE